MKYYYYLALFTFSSFLYSQTPGSESAITPINASIAYQGFGEGIAHLGTGEYKIYYDNVDGVLDKPVFFIDGFDPGNSRTIPLMYDLLNYGDPVSNLGEVVRDQGFDLIVLNFPTYTSTSDMVTEIDGGGDFIQRNAFILIELIKTINELKIGDEKNVVIGPSMGGLISRYALSYIEQNIMDLDHETRLYISFDSPHNGANVPIGLQYLFNYMLNGDPAITSLEPVVNGLLNSAAAKQMLIDHYTAHLLGGSTYLQDTSKTLPAGALNFRDAFQTELDAIGFPQETRNISISNGSGLAVPTGSPGMNLIDHTFDTGVVGLFNTRAIIKTYFTPQATSKIIVTDFVGQFDLTGFGTWVNAFDPYIAEAESLSPTSLSGIDSAPGGQFDLFSFDDGSDPLITEFVTNLKSQYFNFIPTLSSLDINESNLYTIPDTSSSPFANTFIPDANEPHVTLTDANVAFALNEIFSGTLSSNEFANLNLRLEKNPIDNDLVLISSDYLENSKIDIIDITGKKVYSDILNINSKTSIPLNISSGFYVLTVNSNDKTFKEKIIIK